MSQRKTTTRHHLIINKFRHNKHVTFREISDYLARESEISGENFNISKRTFQRDLDEIGSIYGIYIEYDFSEKYYYIEEEFEQFNDRLFEAFDVYHALKMSERNLQYIYLDNRKTQGTENLYGLLHAIKNQLQVSFLYEKYDKEFVDLRTVNPLALKEFKYRWYLFAQETDGSHIKTYALDRLANLEIQKIHFNKESDFNLDNKLKHCFGIITQDNGTPKKVILSFTPHQGKYIKSLPLHQSQKILIDNDKELQISLNIFITKDFKMEILSMGETVTVIEPKSLKEDLKKTYMKALEKLAK